jgi:amidase
MTAAAEGRDAPDWEWAARYWRLETEDLTGFDAALENVRNTYARVEALAAATGIEPPADPGAMWRFTRIAGADPYKAWMCKTEARHAAPATGPLAGHRLAIKDSIAVAGVPMTLGGDFLRAFVPSRSAVAVERALGAGAMLAGTAVCEDLCYSGSSFTSATGPVLNPYDPSRAAGGSSSGCAVVLAIGEADLALGTDLGGSVRNPAAWCGICALKPTFGLVPYTGALPTEFSMDHLGLMARSAHDVALLLDAVAGASECDPRQAGLGPLPSSFIDDVDRDLAGTRIGLVQEGFGWPLVSDGRSDALVRDAALSLRRLGAAVDNVSVPLHRHARDIHVPISCEGGLATVFEQNTQGSNHTGCYDPQWAAAFGQALEENRSCLPLNAKIALIAGTVLRRETKSRVLALAQRLRKELRQQFDRVLGDFDLLIMPTVPMLPHPLPRHPLPPGEHQRLSFEMHDNNCATNLTGHPALSVPCGLIDGLPVGMLLIGRHLQDHILLRAAHHFQTRIYPSPSPPQRHDGVSDPGSFRAKPSTSAEISSCRPA